MMPVVAVGEIASRIVAAARLPITGCRATGWMPGKCWQQTEHGAASPDMIGTEGALAKGLRRSCREPGASHGRFHRCNGERRDEKLGAADRTIAAISAPASMNEIQI
jgi:hypothetical protein